MLLMFRVWAESSFECNSLCVTYISVFLFQQLTQILGSCTLSRITAYLPQKIIISSLLVVLVFTTWTLRYIHLHLHVMWHVLNHRILETQHRKLKSKLTVMAFISGLLPWPNWLSLDFRTNYQFANDRHIMFNALPSTEFVEELSQENVWQLNCHRINKSCPNLQLTFWIHCREPVHLSQLESSPINVNRIYWIWAYLKLDIAWIFWTFFRNFSCWPTDLLSIGQERRHIYI